MKGLELAERYWEEVGRPSIEKICPEAMKQIAVGLAGEGSECMGFDDEISRDHDWGPAFCIWLSDNEEKKYGDLLRKIYSALPDEYLGYKRIRVTRETASRVGVMGIKEFFDKYAGVTEIPGRPEEWLALNEEGLSVSTNGKIFWDGTGQFTSFRKQLLNYYPEDVWKKKLAGNLAAAAQAGQYNYLRCIKRGDRVAMMQALTKFIEHIQTVFFILNKKYKPYYKWANRMLHEMGSEEKTIAEQLGLLTEGQISAKSADIEYISSQVIKRLKVQGYTLSSSDFLLDHGVEIQEKISDEQIRQLPLMLI